jgi:antitoxin CptB
MPNASAAAHLSRLRWHCRRGMRELDVLLMKYFEQVYPGATPQMQQAFEALLELQDPVILAYLTGKAAPEQKDIADVIAQLSRIGG